MTSNSGHYRCETPVVFVIFNRPDTTQRVFEEIAKVRPRKLLVIADGPRADRKGEAEACLETRSIIEKVDWDCEVLRNFAEKNLGCKHRVSSGISWAFEQVEEAIILEDDCIPHPTFFEYCERLLDIYRDDERIMSISGDNFQFGRKRGDYSIYFSRHFHVWGWASWRRAWQYYDVDIKLWPAIRTNGRLYDVLGNIAEVSYWSQVFDDVSADRVDTWDYQWTFAHWMNRGLCILPQVNLVSNIGFGENATHTRKKNQFADMDTAAIEFPLRVPPYLIPDYQADRFTDSIIFSRTIFHRLYRRLRVFLR